ncbi:MAG: threonyl-tRNA synthetase, partial [Watsoniomyces obsoletus]
MSTQVAPKGPPTSKELPDFIRERNAFFDKLKKEYDQELASRDKPPIKIEFVAETGQQSQLDGKAWETTPGHLLKHVPKDRAGQIVIAKVDNELWDLDRPLEKDSKVSYLTFADSEGKNVFWHSSAHGFFYDMALEPGEAVKESDWSSIENKAKKFAKDKQAFERLVVSKDNLLKMFGYSKYKTHYIDKLVKG